MIEPTAIISSVVVFLVVAGMATLLAGIRRIPWRFGLVIGTGWGTVLTALWTAGWPANARPVDPAAFVLVGAIGGSLTQWAFDRGQRERQRVAAEITAIPSEPVV